MSNLIEITPECFIIKGQSGFKKLLKKLNIHFRKNDTRQYSYDAVQLTKDERAFEVVEYKCTNKTYLHSLNYPIKYPCIVSVNDKTFEIGNYTLYIKYFDDDLCNELKQILNKYGNKRYNYPFSIF